MPRKAALTFIRQAEQSSTESSRPPSLRTILTLTEVADELRCSKAHLQNIVAGKVRNLPPLPSLRLGRRLLVRYDALLQWMLSVEAREVEASYASGNFGPRDNDLELLLGPSKSVL